MGRHAEVLRANSNDSVTLLPPTRYFPRTSLGVEAPTVDRMEANLGSSFSTFGIPLSSYRK
jgi:hypothetical protein